ncbi:Uncharacterised protein [Serratia rubidaea]|uniref:Uncharacterized protein n=1 Tax=Serratia rubidaea TaxID=61652 RepID=A0A3S4GFA2_SERRU|nr:Uncharacterised protein [Serratia rubidaea]
MQAGHAGLKGNADHIHIVAVAGDKLPFRDATHRLDLIAHPRGLFEIQRLAGVLHALNQLMQHLLILTGQKQPHIVNLLPVLFFAHQAGDTRAKTAADLILQTRARAVTVNAVFTLANGKQLLQQRQRFTHGIRVGERAKIFALGVFGAAVNGKPRMGIGAQKDQRIRFIVAQKNIISRLI